MSARRFKAFYLFAIAFSFIHCTGLVFILFGADAFAQPLQASCKQGEMCTCCSRFRFKQINNLLKYVNNETIIILMPYTQARFQEICVLVWFNSTSFALYRNPLFSRILSSMHVFLADLVVCTVERCAESEATFHPLHLLRQCSLSSLFFLFFVFPNNLPIYFYSLFHYYFIEVSMFLCRSFVRCAFCFANLYPIY